MACLPDLRIGAGAELGENCVEVIDPVCAENLIRVDDVMESPKLAE
jgi:hypothetical protein